MFFHSALIKLLIKLKPMLHSGRKSILFVSLMTSLISVAPEMIPALALEFPPTKKGAPARTSGGGVRNPKDSLTALLPESGIHSLVSDRVTLFFNIPEGLSQTGFLLIYSDDDTLFEQEFQLPDAKGLIGISLPPSLTDALTLDQVYDWEFAMLPDGEVQAEEQVVIGQLQRLESIAESPTADPMATANYYAQLNIWQETLEAIAPIHPDYVSEWKSLLGSVKLDVLAKVPWVGRVALPDA